IGFGRRVGHGVAAVNRRIAAWRSEDRGEPVAPLPFDLKPIVDARFASRTPVVVTETIDPTPRQAYAYPFRSLGAEASLPLVASDSTTAATVARAAQAVVARADSASALGPAVDAAAETLRVHGVRDALIQVPGAARAMGASADGTPWSLVVPDPRGRI